VRVPTSVPVAVAAVAVLLAASEPAAAQVSGATRPYRALFGGSAPNPDVHHGFDVTMSLSAGYDDNAADGSAESVSVSPLLQTGGYLGLAGTASYVWQTKRVQVAGNLSTITRYYQDVSDLVGSTHTASIGVSAELGQRGRVYANQSVSYAPSYLYSLLPALGTKVPGRPVGGGRFPLGDESVFVFDTSATAWYSVTRRGSIEGLAMYRHSGLPESSGATVASLRSYGVGGRFRQGISRYATLQLGYVYREGQYGFVRANASTTVHDIDAGVDYERALSLTRRTTLDFSTGSAIVSLPALAVSLDQVGGTELQFRLVGNVGLTHEMGRTWRARIAYNRDVGFAEAFAQPVFADAVTASLTGFFNRRIDLTVTGGFSSGEVGLGRTLRPSDASNSSFHTWNFTARSRYALGSMWAMYGEYLYYSQDLGSAVIVPSGLPSVLDRQTIQVGLTFWVPLLRR
jgi:hypothetical protein